MIWKRQTNLEAIQKFCQNTLCSHLGMVFTDLGPEHLSASMPVDHRTVQPAGLLHGGASVALAESLGSIASALCLPEDSDKMPVGVEINANHLKSIKSGFVYGKATALRIGSNLHVWNIDIRNESQELLCVSRLTVMLAPKKVLPTAEQDLHRQ